ncbi:permease [Clostridium sp. HBUAS56010]|uniref:permease n=1 Tax=Clostridium sp. HBUAS56010 TaxID=2571127 RepID=UPI001178A874|nr:permease [Clostridium sp. HBUAS56010]
MTIPIFIVTGFLDAGKTTFIKRILNNSDHQKKRVFLIQFEHGEENFKSMYFNIIQKRFSKRMLENDQDEIRLKIEAVMEDYNIDEVWIEWNGMVPLSELQNLIMVSSLPKSCKIQKVIHMADGRYIENLIGKTGVALLEQISNSDLAVVRNGHLKTCQKRIKSQFRCLNSNMPVIFLTEKISVSHLERKLYGENHHPVYSFFVALFLLLTLHYVGRPVLESYQIPVNTLINIFLGMILQALPFLLIGILLSSAIQVLIPSGWLERCFPKSPGLGLLVAVAGGFLLPVCDCVSIPVFRSLVQKGIPLPAAVTFMAVSPVVNPVVILSTYYAFQGDMTMVYGRICLGIVSGILIGISMKMWAPQRSVLSGFMGNRLLCGCGFYGDLKSATGYGGKIRMLLQHSQVEFFRIGKYLMAGTLIASVFQVAGANMTPLSGQGADLTASTVFMMMMAFVLSLCSSSDAVIGRSFGSQFPTGAIMAFLIFGPVMDIKNILILKSGFSYGFVARLFVTTSVVCFSVIILVYSLGV